MPLYCYIVETGMYEKDKDFPLIKHPNARCVPEIRKKDQ